LQIQRYFKVKKEAISLTKKVYANPNEQDNKGITPLMQLLYHRTNTFEMALSLLVAGADPNIISKRGSTVFDALFRERNYISTKPPWDGCNTAFLLIKGSDRWTALERSEITFFKFTKQNIGPITEKISKFKFLTGHQKERLLDSIQTKFKEEASV